MARVTPCGEVPSRTAASRKLLLAAATRKMRSSSISLFMTDASCPVSLLVNCSRLWNYKIATIPYTRRARLPRLTTPRNAPLRTTQQGTRMNAATLITAYYDAFNRGDREAMLSMRSEEHTSELQSLMRISYAVFGLKKNNTKQHNT